MAVEMCTASCGDEVILGLGSNLGSREEHLWYAVNALRGRIGDLKAISTLYETEPVLHPQTPTYNQESFLNLAVVFGTTLSAPEILQVVGEIERERGRNRDAALPWSPRTLDIDILACGSLVLESDQLTIPHPRLAERAFVVVPLHEVAPTWRHPVLGVSVVDIRRQIPSELTTCIPHSTLVIRPGR